MSSLGPPDLPSTAERPPIQAIKAKRPFGVRLWLALMFAAIGILTGTSVYLFVSESSEGAAEDRATQLAQGRALDLATDLGSRPAGEAGQVVSSYRSDAFAPWVFNQNDQLLTNFRIAAAGNAELVDVPNQRLARRTALSGRRFLTEAEDGLVVVALPIFRDNDLGVDGAVLVQAERPREVEDALASLRDERLTALGLAVLLAAIIGFSVASLITSRVKRLATAAGRIAEGDLNQPLEPRGRDEIGDLGRALDSMRLALAESFDALSSERDRLSAIFVSLNDAVIVVGADGDVRFANPAATELIADGQPVEALRPWIRRATHRGTVESDHVQIGEQVVAINGRHLPAESAVLIVVRDRTEELRRDEAEREFVSNAAHELRNPIAGMSGAIEVLRSGAKDDPEARDHFLERLDHDVNRVSRLTKSLLTLARVEATGQGEAEVVSIDMVLTESAATAEPPSGLTLEVEPVEDELVAEADPVLLRQVVIGLLTNAYKHTPAPGAVTLRAFQSEDKQVIIEVEDTGGGIPEEERDRVFERFYRGSGSLEREGFGLGLAIAKRMIDVMGGKLTVESEEGRGSTFTICLRQAAPSPTPVA